MANTVYRAYKGSSLAGCGIAEAPGAELYVLTHGGTAPGAADIGRVDSSDAFAWQKTLTAGAACEWYITSSTGHLVVAAALTGSYVTYVALLSPTGALLWQVQVPARVGSEAGIAVTSDGVYVFGPTNSNTESPLAKLAIADGSLSWVVNLRTSSLGTGTNYASSVRALSGGDVVVGYRGPVHTNAISYSYVSRIDKTSGARTWTSSVAFPTNFAAPNLAVDPSDNIYVFGPAYAPDVDDNLPVVKLDSSGALLWGREAQYSVLMTEFVGLSPAKSAVASASGVMIPTTLSTSTYGNSHSAVFLPAAGTVAAGTAAAVHYYGSAGITAIPRASALASSSTAFTQIANIGGGSDSAFLFYTTQSAADDRAFGGLTRDTLTWDVVSSTSTAASASLTMAAAPSYSVAPASMTEGSSTLSLQVYVATGGQVDPWVISTVFGNASVDAGTGQATSLGVVTNFGEASAAVLATATSVSASTTFGTAAYDPVRRCDAQGIAPVTSMGTPISYRDPTPQAPGRARGSLHTQFGNAVATAGAACDAAGFAGTVFGAATAGQAMLASGFSDTLFGSASAANPADATGFRATQFGEPGLLSLAVALGWSRTMFGDAHAESSADQAATGTGTTSFGSATYVCQTRARSGVFRTQFGSAAAEVA